MFKIIEGDFKNQTYGDETYLTNVEIIINAMEIKML